MPHNDVIACDFVRILWYNNFTEHTTQTLLRMTNDGDEGWIMMTHICIPSWPRIIMSVWGVIADRFCGQSSSKGWDIASRVMCGQLSSKGWGYCVTGDVWSVILYGSGILRHGWCVVSYPLRVGDIASRWCVVSYPLRVGDIASRWCVVSYPLRVGDIASRMMCGQLSSKGRGYCVTMMCGQLSSKGRGYCVTIMCGQLSSKGSGYCVTGDVWSVIL